MSSLPTTPHRPTLVDLRADRDRYVDLIVQSNAPKKLVVAGPGTGKTTLFERALDVCGGRGLALTFINNLVKDLEKKLGNVADAFTFHRFCKHLLHKFGVVGLTRQFEYYPPLFSLLAEDLKILGRPELTPKEIERCLHTFNDDSKGISEVLRLGSYYDAVAHTDLVFRMLLHFRTQMSAVPQYPLVVVDEYQDFSLLEAEFIKLLGTKSPVLIAGDDDQALYSFKHASPEFIRELAASGEFARFELPYCSRCTEVIVNAVADVVRCATDRKKLSGRIDKPFYWFPPQKEQDSKEHPSIIHAMCTVETKKTPLMGLYIAEQIRNISAEDVRGSREDGEPTVLVIGPPQFVRLVYRELQKHFSEVEMRESEQPQVDCVHGYEILSRIDKSRLGWRILLHCLRPQSVEEVVKSTVAQDQDFVAALPQDFRSEHLSIAKLVGKVALGKEVSGADEEKIATATSHSMLEVRKILRIAEEEKRDADPQSPHIVCTTLLGAKGLAARYVFLVGMNNGHLPVNASAITDGDICQFIVGLTRTRKQCYVLSCGRFGGNKLSPSVFLNWIGARLRPVSINAAHFK